MARQRIEHHYLEKYDQPISATTHSEHHYLEKYNHQPPHTLQLLEQQHTHLTRTLSSAHNLFLLLSGSNTFFEAAMFIQQLFEQVNPLPWKRRIHTHLTCATDTDNIGYIFESVIEVLLQNNLNATYALL